MKISGKILDKIFMSLAILLVIFAGFKIYSYSSHKSQKLNTTIDADSNILLYTKKTCIYCIKAKKLLDEMNLTYDVVDLTFNKDLHLKLANKTGQTTVPYIFINDEFIGGYSQLSDMVKGK